MTIQEENHSLIQEGLKRCTKCQEVKALEEYSPHPKGIGGKQPRCRSCMRSVAPPRSNRTRLMEQVKRARRGAKDHRVASTLAIEDWLEILAQHQKGEFVHCYLCGEVITEDMCLEHLQPLSRGGSNISSNVRPAHRFCNNAKSYKTPEELIVWCQKVLANIG